MSLVSFSSKASKEGVKQQGYYGQGAARARGSLRAMEGPWGVPQGLELAARPCPTALARSRAARATGAALGIEHLPGDKLQVGQAQWAPWLGRAVGAVCPAWAGADGPGGAEMGSWAGWGEPQGAETDPGLWAGLGES